MLFSTILPTAVHGFVSLLGVQGIWPRSLRRPVAGWVERAPNSPGIAVGAGLALGVVWAVPLIGLGAILWVLWAFVDRAVIGFLGWYFDALSWIARGPVGAF